MWVRLISLEEVPPCRSPALKSSSHLFYFLPYFLFQLMRGSLSWESQGRNLGDSKSHERVPISLLGHVPIGQLGVRKAATGCSQDSPGSTEGPRGTLLQH